MTTMDVNVQEDLNAVNDQLTKLLEELNKVNSTREQLITQVQNLNGVSMYLKGKLPLEAQSETPHAHPHEDMVEASIVEDSIERSNEYPVAGD